MVSSPNLKIPKVIAWLGGLMVLVPLFVALVSLYHTGPERLLFVLAIVWAADIGAFFAGALLIETIFSLDGLGLLGFESVLNRDYPVVFATLYIFSLLGLVVNLISDLTYTWIDPRIDFETREV